MFVPRRVISAWGISVRMDVFILIFEGFFWRPRIYQNPRVVQYMHLVDALGRSFGEHDGFGNLLSDSIWMFLNIRW